MQLTPACYYSIFTLFSSKYMKCFVCVCVCVRVQSVCTNARLVRLQRSRLHHVWYAWHQRVRLPCQYIIATIFISIITRKSAIVSTCRPTHTRPAMVYISLSTLVLIARAVLLLEHGHKHTDKSLPQTQLITLPSGYRPNCISSRGRIRDLGDAQGSDETTKVGSTIMVITKLLSNFK